MDTGLLSALKTLVLVTALSVDAFVASFSFGARKVKIPVFSIAVINLVCTVFLAGSMLLGGLLTPYLPSWLTTGICFTILFSIGLTKLLQKPSQAAQHVPNSRYIQIDNYLSPFEAALLSIALSLDGLSVGFGIGLTAFHIYQVILYSLITNTAAILCGCWLGHKMADRLKMNLTALSGILLMLLALMKL